MNRIIGFIVLVVTVAAVLVWPQAADGITLAALPYVFRVTCTAINEFPTAAVDASTAYARVHFVKAAAEASDDRMEDPVGNPLGELIFMMTQAQRDDFAVGSDYDIDITAA